MTTTIDTLIPGNLDTILDDFNLDDSENYRLTLLHKNEESMYCWLSSGMDIIRPGVEQAYGYTLKFGGKGHIDAHPGVMFSENSLGNEFFYSFTKEDVGGDEDEKIIPFAFKAEPPSEIIDKSLQSSISNYMERGSQKAMKGIEYLGEHGLFKTILKGLRNRKGRKARRCEWDDIGEKVGGFFHEDQNPSRIMQKTEYSGDIVFEKKSKKLKYLPVLAVAPHGIGDAGLAKMREAYENRFSENSDPELEVISGMILGKPEFEKGFLKFWDGLKHAANASVYVPQLAVTATAYSFAHPIISYPLMAITAGSTLTGAYNLLKSKGRDSSGMVSSMLNKTIKTDLV